MRILKFGGTSVGTAQRIKALATLIHDDVPKIVVLSAMSGTTNSLTEIVTELFAKNHLEATRLTAALEIKYYDVIKQLYATEISFNKANDLLSHHFNYIRSFSTENFTEQEEGDVLARGELLSTALLQFYLEENNMDSILLQALEFMRIDENEEPDYKFIESKIKSELAKYSGKKLFITQGYICKNSQDRIANLKRGGSDYTATIIGAAVQADEIQIWTDIDGMHNNDPRIVDRTSPIAELSFDEAAELAYFGAKILHPTCILPAKLKNIPVKLLNTMKPDAKGTIITAKSSSNNIKAVAAKDNITAIKIKSGRMLLAYGFLRAVFEIFERYKTPIDTITTSEVAVSLTVDNKKNLDEIEYELKKFCHVEVDHDLTIVCVVGNFSGVEKGYASRIFTSLKNIPIRMISYGGSENNISIVVKTDLKKETLIALNNGLF